MEIYRKGNKKFPIKQISMGKQIRELVCESYILEYLI